MAAAGADVATIGKAMSHALGSGQTLAYLHMDDERPRDAVKEVAETYG